MTTLAEQRAAIAQSIRAARAPTSEAARRATGQAMVERRTGKSQVDDINAVVQQTRTRSALPTVDSRGSVPAQRGTGTYQAPSSSSGSGIASPLTETPGTRTYHTSLKVIASTDGSTFISVQLPSAVTMTDATGAEVIFNYAENIG